MKMFKILDRQQHAVRQLFSCAVLLILLQDGRIVCSLSGSNGGLQAPDSFLALC
jgi:hypothetical protein